jgi:hypothetical protein
LRHIQQRNGGSLQGENVPTDDTASLERSLREATRRAADLEKRMSEGATASERIDALSARLHRIESVARTAPAPAPVPAAPAPAPIPGP